MTQSKDCKAKIVMKTNSSLPVLVINFQTVLSNGKQTNCDSCRLCHWIYDDFGTWLARCLDISIIMTQQTMRKITNVFVGVVATEHDSGESVDIWTLQWWKCWHLDMTVVLTFGHDSGENTDIWTWQCWKCWHLDIAVVKVLTFGHDSGASVDIWTWQW